jgi:hypothetical protein
MKNKPVADARNEVVQRVASDLPPKKPPAPSVKHRLRRAKVRNHVRTSAEAFNGDG